jgi:hypothetical protein
MTVKDMKTRRPIATGFNITQEALSNSSAKLVPADTLIIATRMGLGKVVRAPFATAINQDLKALFPADGVEKSFLEYWLVSIATKLEGMGTGTTVKGLRLSDVTSLPCPSPPRTAPHRREDRDALRPARQGEEAVRQVQALLKRYRQSVLKAAVTGELTADWREANRDRLEHGRDLLARILKTRRETWEGRGRYKEPVAPDTSGLPELPEGWMWAADCIRMATAKAGVCRDYVATAIASRLVQNQIQKISKGVAQQKVTLANFKKIAIPLPTFEEQKLIAALGDEQIAKLEDLKRLVRNRTHPLRRPPPVHPETGLLGPPRPAGPLGRTRKRAARPHPRGRPHQEDAKGQGMSDIKLFRREGTSFAELAGSSAPLEKALQTLFEKNLDALLGVRFVASEYATSNGGRMDTLGLDENGSPVIIEYKRTSSENVINQGLFYLDWLLDHRGDFEVLVMKTLGVKAAEQIEWTAPRLICIAADFTKYDTHAVKQMGRNIELVRYKTFGETLLTLELLTAVSAAPAASGNGAIADQKAVKYKTVSDSLSDADTDLANLCRPRRLPDEHW